MKKYNSYKPSGIEWLGNVPNHWELNRVKNIGTVKGRVGWKALKASEYVDSGYFFLSTPNIKNTEIDYKNVNYITSERYFESPEIMLKNGDILLVKDGSTLGIVNIVKHLPSEGTVNSSIAVLSFKKVINEYVYFLLLSDYVQNEIQLKKDGMGVPHLFQKDINNFILLLPPLSEQTAIAQYLDTKTQAIDKKVNLLTKKAATYKELRKSIINDAVCKGLDKGVKFKESGIEWIGKIPKHWRIGRLKDIAKVQTGNTPPMAEKENYSDIGLPWVKPNELFDLTPTLSSTDYISDIGKEQVRIIKKGSVMVCCIGSIGKMGFAGVDLCTNQQINSISFYKIIPEYGKYLIFVSKDEHLRHSTGNVVAILNCENQKRIDFAYPPLKAEQTQIATYLDEKTQKIDAIINNLQLTINHLKELRKTLINDVVTGKIKVTA